METSSESQTAFVGYSTTTFPVGYEFYVFPLTDTPVKRNLFFLSLQVFIHLYSSQQHEWGEMGTL